MSVTAVEQKHLFINNQWRPASAGKTMDVINPATEEVMRDRCLGGCRRFERRRRSGAGGAERAVGADVGARARPAGAETRRTADGACRRSGAARDAAQRQADQRVATHRDPGGGRMLRVLRRLGRQGDGRDDSGQRQLPHLHAPRADRRRAPQSCRGIFRCSSPCGRLRRRWPAATR